jgi:threonine aldolase
LAAAGIYVLENHIERLIEDHENARQLGESLAGISKLRVDPIQTNMVFVDLSEFDGAGGVTEPLKRKGIKIGGYTWRENNALSLTWEFRPKDIRICCEELRRSMCGVTSSVCTCSINA